MLTQQQQRAAACPSQRVLVLAGPGTGKTTVLSHRIAYLIKEQKVRPEQICALTFTRSAALEMKARIEFLAPESRGKAAVRTFHSLAYRFLKQLTPNLRIISPLEQVRIFREICPEEANFQRLKREISRAKNKMLSPEELPPEVRDAVMQYEQRKEGCDYDDLLILLLEVLKKDGSELKERFTHVLVDEFQDLSPLQYEIVKELSKGKSLFAVGDPLQCIYEWRASTPEVISRLESDFEPEVIYLTENFRSKQKIIEAANKVMKAIDPKRPPLQGVLSEEGTLLIKQLPSEEEEMQQLIESVSKEKDLSECAVLVRTNDQTAEIERKAASKGLSISKRYSIFGKKEVQFVLELLKLILDPELNHKAILKIAPLIDPYLGRSFRSELKENAEKHNLTLLQALKGSFSKPYLAVGAKKILEAVEHFHSLSRRLSPSELLLRLRKELNLEGFLGKFMDEEDDLLYEPAVLLDKLTAVSESFKSLEEFLAWTESSEKKTLNVMTIHRAKGLEFKKVYLPFVHTGSFPLCESEEEWRLFFVAVTRARDSLILTSTASRKSPFLSAVLEPKPEELKQKGMLGKLQILLRLFKPKEVRHEGNVPA